MRNLLAGDLMADVLPAADDACVVESVPQLTSVADMDISSQVLAAEGEGVAEGEDQPDLVAFAKALDQAGVKYYGGAWCAHCTDQKELFEDGAHYLPFIEVTNPDRTLNQIGLDANVSSLPTWEFPDQTRLTGVQTLETISQRSGVAIPTSSAPSLAPIDDLAFSDDQNADNDNPMFSGSPIHIPLDGYDPNGDSLTYTVSISGANASDVSWEIIQGNRSLRMDVGTYGEMVFELFEGRAPRAAERVIELAEDGFYDGIIFHRVIQDFVIQGGDPGGTGSGGSTLGDFDDQFHGELQHNRNGMMSYAKSGDDTNDSQFFVTLDPTRFLDFNHSVFGILVEGYEQLAAIGSIPTDAATDKPTFDVAMSNVQVFTDNENAVLMLSAPEGVSGVVDVTVTASDPDGNSTQQTFQVDILEDIAANGGANGGPFLEDFDPITIKGNEASEIQLSAIDVEGDPVYYEVGPLGDVDYAVDVDNDTGLVTLTSPAGFVGEFEVLVAVRAADSAPNDTQDTWDRQVLTITVTPETPSLDLLAISDSNIDTDNITNETDLTFRVSSVVDGATVQILNGQTVIAEGVADGNTIDLTTDDLAALGDGVYTLTAIQSLNDDSSDLSTELQVTLDTTGDDFTSTAPDVGVVGHFMSYNVEHPDEGTGDFSYSVTGLPDGATFDAATGVLNWTPTSVQTGTNDIQVTATDVAGNTASHDVSIDVTEAEQWMQIRLEVSDLDGNVIDTIQAGQDYWLRVYVQDIRAQSPTGVFAAYIDVNYDGQLSSAVGANYTDITYGDEYQNGRTGDLTTPGLLDDIGSFGPTSSLDASEYLQMTIVMSADAAGDVLFYGDPGDDIGHGPLVFGHSAEFSWDQVTILPTTLTITEGSLVAEDDLYNVDEDSDNVLDVLTNDTNDTGEAVTVTAVGQPSHGGVVTIAGDGLSVSYEPADDFFGEEQFSYTINADGLESIAVVTVQVFPKNDAPTANDDDFTIDSDSEDNFLNVLGNDEIAPDENETLRVTVVGTPANGTVEIAPNGTHLLYTPDAGFAGTDTFSYTISDGTGADALTSEATLMVTVEDTPRPTANDDDGTVVDEDSGPTVIDVLANDTPDQDGANLEVIQVTPSANGGTVAISNDGADVTYTPAADFYGTDTFTYTVQEENGGTAQATVTVEVSNLNDPPTANDDEFNVVKDDGMKVLDVLDNDSVLPDPDGTLTITDVSTGSAGGTIEISSDGRSIEYTNAGFEGTETFSYTIDDGSGETAEATVTVNVQNYAPRSAAGWAMQTGRGTLGGVEFDLAGQDAFDADVDLADATVLDGGFQFKQLAPGDYTVQAQSLAFLIDTRVMERAFQSELDDGDMTGLDFEYPGRRSQHMSLSDLLATAPNQSSLSVSHSVVVAIEPGGSELWYLTESGWEDYIDGGFELSEDLSEITVTATEADGDQVFGTIDATDSNLVRWLSSEGDAYLLRITAGPADIDFQPVDNGEAEAEGGGEAEGEAPVAVQAETASFGHATPTPVTATQDGVAGEGESDADLSALPTPAPVLTASYAAELTPVESTTEGAVESQVVDVAWFADSPSGVGSETELTTGGALTPSVSDDSAAAVDAVLADAAFEDEISSVVWEVAESNGEGESLESDIDAALTEESLWVLV